jgi:post-segregation antitoxin (ccd killing protein)
MKKKPTNITLTEAVKAAAQEEARKRGMNLSVMIEQMLRKELKIKHA